MNEKELNNKQRIEAVERWAKYVVENDVKKWSRLQAELIDSQIENAKNIKLTKEQVKYIKGK